MRQQNAYVGNEYTVSIMCSSRKYLYSPYRRDWNFLGDRSSIRPKNLKKCMKLNIEISREVGGGALRKNPFCVRGMDIFWKYTMRCKTFN